MVVEDIELPSAVYTSQFVAEKLALQLYKKVMITGMHPGHSAVVYNDGAVDDLFPRSEGGFLTFVEAVNSSLKGLSVKGQASHMLQLTPDINESLLCNKSLWYKPPVDPLPLTISLRSTVLSSAEETAEYEVEKNQETK